MSALFTCPHECLPAISEVFGGEYAFPVKIPDGNSLHWLDIGANVGAFTVWVGRAWPKARFTCYEPNPDLYRYLENNTRWLVNRSIVKSAVGDPSIPWLYRGTHSPLCASQYQWSDVVDKVASIPVEVLHPRELPEADIVKIDAEGAEGFIIPNMTYAPRLLIFEWHGHKTRRICEEFLADKMRLVMFKILSPETGILGYVNHEP